MLQPYANRFYTGLSEFLSTWYKESMIIDWDKSVEDNEEQEKLSIRLQGEVEKEIITAEEANKILYPDGIS